MPQIEPKVDERDSWLEQIRTKVWTCNLFLYTYFSLIVFKGILYSKLLFGSLSLSTWSLLWLHDLGFKVQKQIWSLLPSWRKLIQFARSLLSLLLYFYHHSWLWYPFSSESTNLDYWNRLWLEVMKMMRIVGVILEFILESVLNWWIFWYSSFVFEPGNVHEVILVVIWLQRDPPLGSLSSHI